MVVGFFHIACMGENWKYIVEEILFSINHYKLHRLTNKINITILGEPEEREYVKSILNNYFDNYSIIYESSDLSEYEFPTLIRLQEFSKIQKCKIWYIHSKGVSRPRNYNMDMWRRLMIWGVIENTINCLDLLEEYNAVGTIKEYYAGKQHIYHGNWWWANSSYIKTLPEISFLMNNPKTVSSGEYFFENKRLQCEYWVYFHNVKNCHTLIPGEKKSWCLYGNLKLIKTINNYNIKDYLVIKNVNPFLENFNQENLNIYYTYIKNNNKCCILDTVDGDGIVECKNNNEGIIPYIIDGSYYKLTNDINLKGEKYFFENF